MPRIVILHPDLGIGGAERLMIDMALALIGKKYEVIIYTSHHDTGHCFSETKDGTIQVISMFDWLPRALFGRFYAFCAFLRMIFLAIYVRLFVQADIFIADQVSLCIPFLQFASSKKVIFYCHYPDLLLTDRKTIIKQIYRKPLDYLEGWSTAYADKIFVNSLYTQKVAKNTFKQNINCEVLYPSINDKKFDEEIEDISFPQSCFGQASYVFLSLNRYERKKNIGLALNAMAYLKEHCEVFQECHMIIAGGYDERVPENVDHHQELKELSQKLNIHDNVSFLKSISFSTKLSLFCSSTALLYTPSNEHFGIVPVESMYCKLPVIAVNSGGPLETIENSVTGFLCEPTPKKFGDAMLHFIQDSTLKERMGNAGNARVKKMFSFDTFANKLDHVMQCLI